MTCRTFETAIARLQARLLALRTERGHWQGRLSSSALSTATAAFALAGVDGQSSRGQVKLGLEWLVTHQNGDGGWGDSPDSPSNLSTTALCWAALSVAERFACDATLAVRAAEAWLVRHSRSSEQDRLASSQSPGIDPNALARAIQARYGKDRTFAVPILAMCALAGRLGPADRAWRLVPPLPFELAALPHRWLQWLRLPVVSYALPALIAIGQAINHFRRPTNPVTRWIRRRTGERTLRLLEDIQPAGGGFLEATPLTSFVAMCLAAIGRGDHPVVRKGCEFLRASMRPDGGWPIDTNLATWVTTLAVNALSEGTEESRAGGPAGSPQHRAGGPASSPQHRAGGPAGSPQHRAGGPAGSPAALDEPDRRIIRDWLLRQQFRVEHPYTHSPPGGWAWTDLAGGVPDADDTAGALRALRRLGPIDAEVRAAASAGVRWLLGLQNRDGGIPTFCRGWGALDFDRSSPDLTAHALAAWNAWRADLPAALVRRVDAAAPKALAYLARSQQPDGRWVPRWFGNQAAPRQENPVYGTARVLAALAEYGDCPLFASSAKRGLSPLPALARGVRWLLSAQNPDGGWGGDGNVRSSVEETAVAADALAAVAAGDAKTEAAVARGAGWLIERLESTGYRPVAEPIGLYFARLWYGEDLYPLVFALSALRRARPPA